ncbi:MAG: hypothetical protein WBM44_25115 [Waterburya sp.]
MYQKCELQNPVRDSSQQHSCGSSHGRQINNLHLETLKWLAGENDLKHHKGLVYLIPW